MVEAATGSAPAHRFAAWKLVILVLGLVSIALLARARLRSGLRPGVHESYVIRGRTVQLEVHPDHLGLTLHEGVSLAELDDHPSGGAVHVRAVRGRVHVLDPEGTHDRDGLTDLARRYLEVEPTVVERAGLLVTPAGSKEPLLLTHELIVQFVPQATEAQIESLLRRHGVVVVRRSAHVENLLLLATATGSSLDALEATRLFHGDPLVDYVEPSLVQAVEYLSTPTDDPLFHQQWHHENTGQGGGTVDADIDTPEAWTLSLGSPNVVIAVLEDGFDADHPDLIENLWTDPQHDSAHGWDFEGDDAILAGDPTDRGATAHGTAVAGCAAARGNNGQGVVGSCPECRLMLIRRGMDPFLDSEAIQYAWKQGADIISNSWTYGELAPIPETVRSALHDAATLGRGGKGCVVLFAVRNEQIDICELEDIASLPGLIAVGSITNTDQRTTTCGYGPCIALLGPSRLSQARNFTEGTLNVATTDWRGRPDGYNADPALQVPMDPSWKPCAEIGATTDYTLCFGGTSAATPIVAGVVGLVLSVAPELTSAEVQRLLQDTCDRAEDSQAVYAEADGRSTRHTHGNGRVNAFEAVRLVAPVASGGRAGLDVLLRDNRLDWGNTEQPSNVLFERERGVIGHWQSPDIRVDAPPFAALPASAAAFESFAAEDPIAGQANRVYVRVRNRGPRPAADVRVRLLWSKGGTARARLVWPAVLEGSPTQAGGDAWHDGGTRTIDSLHYSGPSEANGAGDAAGVVAFEFTAPSLDSPESASILDLMAIADCAADPFLAPEQDGHTTDDLVARDNNVALRSVTLVGATPAPGGDWTIGCRLRNPFDFPISVRLELLASQSSAGEIAFSTSDSSLAVEFPGPASVGNPPPGPDARVNWRGATFQLPADADVPVRLKMSDAALRAGLELRQWREVDEQETLLGGLDARLSSP